VGPKTIRLNEPVRVVFGPNREGVRADAEDSRVRRLLLAGEGNIPPLTHEILRRA
jgi:hypothetical protein